jgi:hypothetical protein
MKMKMKKSGSTDASFGNLEIGAFGGAGSFLLVSANQNTQCWNGGTQVASKQSKQFDDGRTGRTSIESSVRRPADPSLRRVVESSYGIPVS